MRLAELNIDVPGIREIPGVLAQVAQRAAVLAGTRIDHVSLCVENANLECYAQRVLARLPASRRGEYQVGDGDQGMRIVEIEDEKTATHLVLAAPTGDKGQLAEFLAETGTEGLQHIAFNVPDLRAAMLRMASDGFSFVGGADHLDGAILETREGEGWLRQTFTEPLFGGFFVELIERNGVQGLRPANMQSLYEINETHQRRIPAAVRS